MTSNAIIFSLNGTAIDKQVMKKNHGIIKKFTGINTQGSSSKCFLFKLPSKDIENVYAGGQTQVKMLL